MPDWWVSTGEHWMGRQGVPFDIKGKRTYVRNFLVLVNSKVVDSTLVSTAPLLPRPLEEYKNAEGTILDRLAFCTNISARQRDQDDWQAWIVTCTYSTDIPGGQSQGPGSQDKNQPELEPATWSWDAEENHEALQQDMDNKPFVNSAGDPFIPAFTQQTGYPILTVSRNELVWGLEQARMWNFVVNKDQFGNSKPGRVLMYPPKAVAVWKGHYQYFRVTYKMKFFRRFEKGRDTWQPYLLDQGMRQLTVFNFPVIGNKTLPVPIIEGGHPVSHPVCLDGKGRKAIRNQVAANGPLGQVTPVYLKFRTLRRRAFKPLGLDKYLGGS